MNGNAFRAFRRGLAGQCTACGQPLPAAVAARPAGEDAAAAVERVRAVLAKAERDAEQSSARMFDGQPFPPSIWHEDLRRALDGGA